MHATTQRYLYTVLFYLAIPVLLLRLLWRSRKNNGYRKRMGERFGFVQGIDSGSSIWLHAVSVGETLAAVPLIKALRQSFPRDPIVVTVTTPTGSDLLMKYFPDLRHVYLPLDLPDAIKRFLDRMKPRLGIIIERELWPNLLHHCAARNIPLLLANARLSDQSYHKYMRIRRITQAMMQCFTAVFAQSKADGERLVQLGLPQQHLQVTGNIKFDLQLPADLPEKGHALRTIWGLRRPIFIAASTHAGEERIILDAYAKIRAVVPPVLLVLVPRHPERFAAVADLCRLDGYKIALRSKQDPIVEQTAILVGDTLGELLLLYATADIAFVGGSLVDVGGHNMIEAAIQGLPVLTGPILHNFVEISQMLLDAQAAKIVNTAEEIAGEVVSLLNDPQTRDEMGKRGRQVILFNQGALKKHMEWINFQAC